MTEPATVILKQRYDRTNSPFQERLENCSARQEMGYNFVFTDKDTESLKLARKAIKIAHMIELSQLSEAAIDQERGKFATTVLKFVDDVVAKVNIRDLNLMEDPITQEAVNILRDITDYLVEGLNADNPEPVVNPFQPPVALAKQHSYVDNAHGEDLWACYQELRSHTNPSAQDKLSLEFGSKVLGVATAFNLFQINNESNVERAQGVLNVLPSLSKILAEASNQNTNLLQHPATQKAMGILADVAEEVVDGLNTDNQRLVMPSRQAPFVG